VSASFVVAVAQIDIMIDAGLQHEQPGAGALRGLTPAGSHGQRSE